MKICFVGLGSIGCRHLNNMRTIFEKKEDKLIVHAFREKGNELNESINKLIDKQIYDSADLDSDYDIVFITNPTNKHYDSLNMFIDRTKNMFIEKPVFDNSQYKIDRIKSKIKDKGVFYVAAPLRYTKVFKKINELKKTNCVYSARVICSSYLPDWRPNVDYRKVYSAHKEQGGGVSIDCIHEIDYIFSLFGFPEKTYNERGKFSNLEINSEDLSVYIFKYKDKLVELHLDYFGKNKERVIELYTDKGLYKGDFYGNQVIYPDGKVEKFTSKDNDMYINELNSFLCMISGEKNNDNSIEHSFNVLKVAEGEI